MRFVDADNLKDKITENLSNLIDNLPVWEETRPSTDKKVKRYETYNGNWLRAYTVFNKWCNEHDCDDCCKYMYFPKLHPICFACWLMEDVEVEDQIETKEYTFEDGM